MLTERGGTPFTVAALFAQVVESRQIEGISLLGGEPFFQAPGLAELCIRIKRETDLSVMIFSGYTLEELEKQGEAAQALLESCDLLVDGRYEEALADDSRRWIGSSNQTVHFLSERYQPEMLDPELRQKNQLEIRLKDGQLIVNGWPAAADGFRGTMRLKWKTA
jgi:anaerobic ribonucleoside-triphosphate reductase activating protein